MAKKLFSKLVAIAAILFVLNAIYSHTLWYRDIDQHSDTLENLWPYQENSDYLYFGESSNFYHEHIDSPKIRISDWVDQLIPEKKVGFVDNAGLVAGNYLHIMRHIPEDSKVEGLIVTMNLRSFGPTWIYSNNYNYLNRANEMIKMRPKLLNRFFIALNAYETLDDEERLKKGYEAGLKPYEFSFETPSKSLEDWNWDISHSGPHRFENGEWDHDKIGLSCHHVKNFGFQIDLENNPRIQEFDEIVSFANERGFKLAFHLLSENVEESLELVGPELVKIIEYNVSLLKERYTSKGVLVIDNLTTVPEPEFRDRIFPTEHYSNRGKKLCAIKVAKEIKRAWITASTTD